MKSNKYDWDILFKDYEVGKYTCEDALIKKDESSNNLYLSSYSSHRKLTHQLLCIYGEYEYLATLDDAVLLDLKKYVNWRIETNNKLIEQIAEDAKKSRNETTMQKLKELGVIK